MFLHADSEDSSDQTGRMPWLNRVFAGSTCHFVGFCHEVAQFTDPKILAIWIYSVDPVQISALFAIPSASFGHINYSIAKPHRSNWRTFTTISSAVPFFSDSCSIMADTKIYCKNCLYWVTRNYCCNYPTI